MVTGIDIASVTPFAIASVFGMVVLLLEVAQRPSFGRGHLAYITAFGAGLTGFAAVALTKLDSASAFGGMNALDTFGLTATVILSLGAALAALASPNYLEEQQVDRGEYYALLLFSLAGMIAMVTATDFVVFFLGLEIQGVAMYALAGYLRSSARSAEAGLKYFIIGAFASAVLLYGIALLYGATGTTNMAGIGELLSGAVRGAPDHALSEGAQLGILAAAAGFDASSAVLSQNFGGMGVDLPLVAIGSALIIVGFAIKLAAVPFHMWAPDAHTGAPTAVVGFMAAAVKTAGMVALVRVISLALFDAESRMGPYGWVQVMYWLALASMVLGNFVALVQDNVKRMLVYSSAAHTGYLLVAVVAMGFGPGNIDYASSIVFYSFAYLISTIGAFGVLAYLSKRGVEARTYSDLNGIAYKYPWLAACMTVFMLSSAGIPPTAGFIGKLMLFKSAIAASVEGSARGYAGSGMLITLVVVGILTSVVGVAYYLRVLVHMYMKKPVRAVGSLPHSGAKFALVACALLMLWFGLAPAKLADVSVNSVSQMLGRADGVFRTDE